MSYVASGKERAMPDPDLDVQDVIDDLDSLNCHNIAASLWANAAKILWILAFPLTWIIFAWFSFEKDHQLREGERT
jgi:hypothetical protein